MRIAGPSDWRTDLAAITERVRAELGVGADRYALCTSQSETVTVVFYANEATLQADLDAQGGFDNAEAVAQVAADGTITAL